MSDFNSEKFKKKLKKKIKKNITNNKNITINSKKTSFYFVGAVGAAIYYVSTATDFWMGALGLLKSIVWPAFLVYASLKGLNA